MNRTGNRMSVIAQKITVGILGFALFGSVLAVGYVDASRRDAERRLAEFKPKLTPELAQGRAVFEKYSCVVCHGPDGKGALPNFNAQPGGKTPGLDKVCVTYTQQELKDKIRNGVPTVERADPNGPPPPLHMPPFKDAISDGELDQLVNYLFALMPAKDKDAW